MAKTSKSFKCRECGNETVSWYGRCPSCKQYSTLKEQASAPATQGAAQAGLKSATAVKPSKPAATISTLKRDPLRYQPTGIGELDRVLGGGFVAGEVVLMGAAPGTGKSTLCLRVAEKLATQGQTVLYSSGEESEQQIALRAVRMGINDERIKIVNETNLETVLGHIQAEQPSFLVIDSLQTLASSEIPGAIGSIQQSREAANTLTRLAKRQGLTMVLINQVVKGGDFAGSESIQHIVDAALMLESDSESPLKFLRATKNRFGDTTEVGVFQHTERGLEEVADPSGIFLESNDDSVTGAACGFVSEGVRQMPVEVQALVSRSPLPTPRKQFSGVNFQRGQMVCAILDKFCQGRLYDHDVFISTVAGVRVADPQADLATAAALLSSLKNRPVPPEVAFVGELSLTGQVRGAFMVEQKVKEAARLGFERLVVSQAALNRLPRGPLPLKVVGIKTVGELLEQL